MLAHSIFKRSLSEQRFKKWLFSLIISLPILAKRVLFLNILLMCLHESQWGSMRLNKAEWVWMSLNESQIRHKRLIRSSSINMLHDRSRKYWCEHSRKSHTNEKSHASERFWSESHFRLVLNINLKWVLRFTNHPQSVFPVLQSRCSKRKVHLNVIEWEAANDRRKQEIQNELDKSYRIAQRAAAVVVLDLTTK